MHLLSRQQAIAFVAEHREHLHAVAGTNPFARPVWTELFLAEVARDDWTIALAGTPAAGLTFLYREPGAPRRLQALTNYYASQYSALLGAASDRAAMALRLADELTALRPPAATVTLAPLADDADATALQAAFSAGGWYARRYFCFGNWYLPCGGLSFEQYMQGRSSQLHNTWSRKAKKFQKGTDGARLELITAPADVARGMDAWEQVYARSWKVPEPYPAFIRRWAERCATEGWLRLGLAWLGDIPIAAQFWFTLGGRAYIFKLAYDEAYQKLSAGTVLSALLFQQALDVDRVIEIDYLTGDDAYKQSWVSHRRERIGLVACNLRTARGVLAAGREAAGALRRRLQPVAAASLPPPMPG
jgi:CelD/BcsL family acetyltransferase involved in cellulose biosynthesis